MPDFPAAHSMDSTWFAVDDDGHVGVFESGEGGAVPRAVPGPENGVEGIDLLLADGVPSLIAAGAFRPGEHLRSTRDDWWGGVFLLRDPSLAPAVSGAGESRRDGPPIDVDGTRVTPVRFTYVTDERLAAIHERGNCIGCIGTGNESLGRLGLYAYGCEDNGAPPYRREADPSRPLPIAALPTDVRQRLRATVLPGVRFAAAERVQPLEHVDSRTWRADTFEGTDGETYPVGENADIDLSPPTPPPTSQEIAAYEAFGRVMRRHRRRWWQFWR